MHEHMLNATLSVKLNLLMWFADEWGNKALFLLRDRLAFMAESKMANSYFYWFGHCTIKGMVLLYVFCKKTGKLAMSSSLGESQLSHCFEFQAFISIIELRKFQRCDIITGSFSSTSH